MTSGGIQKSSLFVLSCVMAVSVIAGCGAQKPTPAVHAAFHLDCGPKDQIEAFMNPIDARVPAELLVDSRFTEFEKSKIESAVKTWNTWANLDSFQGDIFEIRYADLSAQSMPQSKQDCEFPGASHQLSIIKEMSASHWQSMGLNEYNPGVTVRCQRGQEFVARQVILLFFQVGAKKDQYESIVLHELGHALGLKHSCHEGSGTSNYSACSEVVRKKNHPYHQAVMFPVIEKGFIKNDPSSNDQERAACILGLSR